MNSPTTPSSDTELNTVADAGSLQLSKPRLYISFALLLVYFGFISQGVLFTTEGAFERDAFYHARYAQMLPERGVSRQFPWMQFTDWKDHFSDKDFLYHVFLAPFCQDAAEPLPGAKWATLLIGLAAYTLFFVILLRLKVPWPLFWTILLIAGSGLFFNRMLMVRSHVFSVLLMIGASYFVVRGHLRAVFIMGCVYAWSYSAPVALVITALGAAAGQTVFCGFDWRRIKLPLMAAAGVGVGLVIHPYSPNTLTLLWQIMSISVSRVSGVNLELGSEFNSIWPPGAFASFQNFGLAILSVMLAIPGPLLALIAAMVIAVQLLRKRRPGRTLSPEGAAALGAALAWLVGIFIFSRLVEYFAPLAILAAALIWRDAYTPAPTSEPVTDAQRAKFLGGMLAATVVLAGLHYLALKEVIALAYSTQRHGMSQMYVDRDQWKYGRFFTNRKDGGAVKWLRDHAPAHSVIVNFHWDDFTELYYSAPDYYFLVGLDPTLMRLPYPEQSATLEAMRTKKIPLDFRKLHELFNADYLIMRNTRAAEYPELKSLQIRPAYADEGAVVYRIGP